jgi:hypothetical protein
MLVLKRLITFIATTLPVMIGGVALAASGQPEPWQLGLQAGATPVMTTSSGSTTSCFG